MLQLKICISIQNMFMYVHFMMHRSKLVAERRATLLDETVNDAKRLHNYDTVIIRNGFECSFGQFQFRAKRRCRLTSPNE